MGFGGGLIGGIIGGLIWGLPGAIIGAGIGAYASSDKKGARPGGGGSPDGNTPNEALFALFRCLGKLAKSDGIVSREEADFAQSLLHELNISKADRARAVAAFTEGKTSPLPFVDLVRHVAILHDRRNYSALLEIFCVMALADGTVSDSERAMLKEAEAVFGLRGHVDAFFRSGTGSRQGQSQSRSSASSQGNDDLAEAYQTLGVSPTAGNDEIKKAWRKKAIEFHPDKIQGKGLPEEFVKFANEQTRKINEAYDRICKARGM